MSLYEENETTLAPPNEFGGGTQGLPGHRAPRGCRKGCNYLVCWGKRSRRTPRDLAREFAASGGGYVESVESTLEKFGF